MQLRIRIPKRSDSREAALQGAAMDRRESDDRRSGNVRLRYLLLAASALGLAGFIGARIEINSLNRKMEQTARLANEQAQSASAGAAALRKRIAVLEREQQFMALALRSQDNSLSVAQLLREKSRSFFELYAFEGASKTHYGSACYVGNGYFLTVKHGVVPLPNDGDAKAPATRKFDRIKLVSRPAKLEISAKVADFGDARSEVDKGDWAVLKADESRLRDIPALAVDLSYGFEFADLIYRMGNDYSKGIVASSGYVGQRLGDGLVSSLTDGHPGVSGGGVLDRGGAMVGIPIGRMVGDYRFSFILPLRKEMFRKVPHLRGP